MAGFRFRRRLQILPGLAINLSKNGLSSLSIGGRGATVNVPIGRDGPARSTVGIPGTGLSWSEPIGQRPSTRERRQAQQGSAGQPTTQQLVDMVHEAFGTGPDSLGWTFWHQHEVGMIAVLRQREDTPRHVLEATSLLVNEAMPELHVRRGRGPADTLRRTRQVIDAAHLVVAYAQEIGLSQ